MKRKVKITYFYMLFFLIVFTKPTFVDVMSELALINFIYDGFRVILMGVIPVYYIWKRDYSKIVILISLLYVALFVSTYINRGDIRSIILTSGTVITCSMFADISMRKDKYSLFFAVESLFFIYVICNFFTLIIYPNGWFMSGDVNPDNWFLGNKNLFVMYHIPYLYSTFQAKKMEMRKFNLLEYVGIAATILSTLIARSATGIVGIMVFFLIYCLKELIKRSVTAFLGVMIALMVFVLIVLLDFERLFSFIIVGLLHKDLTLTVRTYVWDAAIQWFKSSPMYGVGVQFTDIAKQNMFGYYHPHCTYLYFLVFGGIVGGILFSLIIWILSVKIDKADVRLSIPAVSMLWAILMIYITEVYSRPELFFICFVTAWTLADKGGKKSISREMIYKLDE